jgi:chorismate mutase/prephenate dehydrogenase
MDLDTLREEIRSKDREIIRLISERTELAGKIGENKRENGLPVRNVEVEKKVIARYVEGGKEYGLSEEVMTNVSLALIKEAVDTEARIAKPMSPKKVAIIGGAGKMGAWMADLMKGSGHEVKIIDPAADNGLTMKDCAGCDIVVVSVPIHLTYSVLSQLDGICSEDALIFDLTSLKTPLVGRLKAMAKNRRVCSVHPMFGPSATSMYGRNLIICDCGSKDAVDAAKELFDDRGANIRIMDVEEHDGYMSYVLGLTHAVNIALFTVLERSGYSFEDLLTVSSTTFNKGLDTNRSVASEDPMLYYEIQHLNSHREEMWSLFTDAVKELREKSLDDDPEGFVSLMNAGRSYFEGN